MASVGTMLFALLWAPAAARELSITDYGAVPGRANNVTAAFENGKALYDAMRAARKGDTVVVPAEQRFVMLPYAPLYGLDHVELRLEGCLAAFEPAPGQHAKVWPFYQGNFASLITIHLSSHVTISGGGALDGRGHNWLGAASMAYVHPTSTPSPQPRIHAQVGGLRSQQARVQAAHVAPDRRLHGRRGARHHHARFSEV